MVAQTARAAVLDEYGRPFVVREFPRPHAEPGGLVVEIEAATVCGSDVHVWRGHLADRLPISPPLILGHEMAGRITEIGPGAERDSIGQDLAIGDRVVWAHASCGSCPDCTLERAPELCANRYVGFLNDCSAPPHFTGTFAEVGIVRPGAGRVRVPDAVESAWAAAGSCALRTVVRALETAGAVDYRHDVVVQGAGPLGLFATALLSLLGPRRLIVVGGPADRLALAAEWGATDLVAIDDHPTPESRVEAVRALTGRGAHVAFELAGAPGAVAEGVEMLAPNGRYVVMGTLGGDPQALDVARITLKGLTVRGSMSGHVGDYARAMELLERHRDRFDWSRMLGGPYGLHELDRAMEAMLRMDDIKPVIEPGKR